MEFKTLNHGFGMGVDQTHTHRLQRGCKEAGIPLPLELLGWVTGLWGGPEREPGWLTLWWNGGEHLEDSQKLFFTNGDRIFSLF